MENNEDKIILKLIDNNKSIESFYKYIISTDYYLYQFLIFLFTFFPALFIFLITDKMNDVISIYSPIFVFLQLILLNSKIKNDRVYSNIIKNKDIKVLKKIKDLSEKQFIEMLLKPLTKNDLNFYLDKIIDNFEDKEDILDIFVKKSMIDIKEEYVVKSKYIKDILEVKSFYVDKTIIELFFENEYYLKKDLSEIDFKTLKYEIFSENIDKYVSSKKSNYIEDIVDYLDEINLNDKSVYILKETLRIKNKEATSNILNEVNNNMVSSF